MSPLLLLLLGDKPWAKYLYPRPYFILMKTLDKGLISILLKRKRRVEGLILKTTQQRGLSKSESRGQVCSPGRGLSLVSAGFHSLCLGRTKALRGGCFLSGSPPGSLYGSLQRSAWEACAGTPCKLVSCRSLAQCSCPPLPLTRHGTGPRPARLCPFSFLS